MPYVLSIGDGEYNTDDLTLDEAIAIEGEVSESWVYINPFRSAKHFKAIARVFLKREGKDDAAIATVLDPMTITAALDSVKIIPDDLPDVYEDGLPDPKAEDETATGT